MRQSARLRRSANRRSAAQRATSAHRCARALGAWVMPALTHCTTTKWLAFICTSALPGDSHGQRRTRSAAALGHNTAATNLRRDGARPCHICAGAGLTPPSPHLPQDGGLQRLLLHRYIAAQPHSLRCWHLSSADSARPQASITAVIAIISAVIAIISADRCRCCGHRLVISWPFPVPGRFGSLVCSRLRRILILLASTPPHSRARPPASTGLPVGCMLHADG